MAGAFTVSQKSALAVRDSQERGEMLQILQGQVELVRSVALGPNAESSGIFTNSPMFFCINPTNQQRVGLSGLGNSLPTLNNDNLSYTAPCGNISGRYNVAIRYDSAADRFIFSGRWEKAGGGKSAMQLSYRVNP
jgi:hypothetical protein